MKNRVLLTCAGGKFVIDTVRALRKGLSDIEILGSDVNSNFSNKHFFDGFFITPTTESRAVLNGFYQSLCEKENIDLIVPLSESDCEAVAEIREILLLKGVRVTIPPLDVVRTLNDKGNLFETLRTAGLPVSPYFLGSSVGGLLETITTLDYPQHKVVMKPRRSSGSRGIFVFDASIDKYESLVDGRECGTGSLEVFKRKYPKIDLSNFLFMPYYSGEVYDVDVVSRFGELLVLSQRCREYTNPFSPTNEGCRLENIVEITDYVSAVVANLALDGSSDFDIVLSNTGEPLILDASVRMSGSVGAAVAAGVNIPAILVSSVLEREWTPGLFAPRYGTRIRPHMTFSVV